ncbi:MAG: hypothetical protein HN348_33005, partial [Proteobacteria bacterium]|nr:hypothetical protein [Pseudomonadota bacterium]
FGEDGVRQTWETGAAYSGTKIWFPDIVEEAFDETFEEFWARYLAEIVVVDFPLELASSIKLPKTVEDVYSLPDHGSPGLEMAPESLGFNVIHFAPDAGAPEGVMTFEFDGDSSAYWHMVLVQTDGDDKKSSLLDYEIIEVTDGSATIQVDNFDGSKHWWVVVSPAVEGEVGPYEYEWSAELLVPEEEEKGCGCKTTAVVGLWPLLLVLGIRGRREPEADSDPEE